MVSRARRSADLFIFGLLCTFAMFTLPGPAAMAGTSPGGLSIVPGDGRAALSWEPVAGAQVYRVHRDSTLVAELPGQTTTWSDTGLVNGSGLRYGIEAVLPDGSATTEVVATPVDLDAPLPVRLRLAQVVDGGLIIRYDVSADVARDAYRYHFYVDGELVGVTAEASGAFSVAGLAHKAVEYAVAVVDHAGNMSRLQTGGRDIRDFDPPPIPMRLRVSACSGDSATIAWDVLDSEASGDASVRYRVWQDGQPIAETTKHSHTVAGLMTGVASTFTVQALDAAGGTSPHSYRLEVTPGSPELTLRATDGRLPCEVVTPERPPVPTKPDISRLSPSETDAGRDLATSGAIVMVTGRQGHTYAGYRLFVDGVLARTGSLYGGVHWRYVAVPLDGEPGLKEISVELVDEHGQISAPSSTTIPVLDQLAPAVPADLVAVVSRPGAATLHWAPVPDATAYEVIVDGRPHATVNATEVELPPTISPTIRTVQVLAIDRHNQRSLPSAPLLVTTT